MERLTAIVLPYLKASPPEGESSAAVALSEADSPILEPFVGDLLVSYVIDEGESFTLVPNRMLRAKMVSLEKLHRAALENLAALIEQSEGIRLAPYGGIIAVLFGGNFEATLMLHDELWPHVEEQIGPDVLAVAPARDVLAVGPPTALAELLAVIERAWPGGDHLLSREVFQRTDGRWRLYRPDH